MSLLIFYLLLTLVVSFFCSIAEAVLLSVRTSYIASLDKEKKSTRILKKMQSNLDRPLAAILTANTIAHTVGAAGVGAQSAVVFGSDFLGITSAVLTFLVLIFSEIIPKTLGAVYWRQLAPTFGILINWLTFALLPLVWCSEKLTRLLSKSGKHASTFSRDEVQAMVEIGKKEGVLNKNEHMIVSNLMMLRHISVRDIMTPRPVIFSASQDMSVQDFFEKHSESPFSRILSYSQSKDDINGYILKSDLLIAQARDQFDKKLSEFVRECPMFSDKLSASEAYDRLIRGKSYIAILTDEYGTVQGLITQEDIVETLIGFEITDELDKVEDMQVLANKKWRERMETLGINPDDIIAD